MVTELGLGVVADVSLSIQIIHDHQVARLVPIGELDVQSASTFAVAGDLAITERPEHLQVDLTQVTFMDSSGVRSLEALVAHAEEAGIGCTVVGRAEGAGEVALGSGVDGGLVRRPDAPDQPPTDRTAGLITPDRRRTARRRRSTAAADRRGRGRANAGSTTVATR